MVYGGIVMVKQITIERFKSIESATLDLGKINVLVGANNSGKSSVLQALQFATSVAQTAKLYSQTTKFDKNSVWATSVYPDQLIYSPVKDPYVLAKGGILKEDINLGISVAFVEDSNEKVTATFRKGRNKNIAARFEGETVGQHLASLENPFSMYVPGLAGIPFEEEIRTVGIVRRIAAKGDSNTVFRNVINLLSQDAEKWELFLSDLKVIFPAIDFTISANPNVDGSIDVRFQLNPSDPMLPIDLAGTGVLQAIQIAAYVNYFKPALLLLDEPDSHLHPNNQRALATLLVSLSDRTETTILISTHSRHLMSALHEDARFFLVKNGTISSSPYDHYVGLLELGALDEYDHIKNGDLKYVILTEDSSEMSRKYLRGILESSGFGRNEFQVYSYNSVSKIESAKMFASFLGKELLRVENLTTEKIKGVSFSLREGEVVGLAGLVGSGRTEVLRAIFAADKLRSGQVILEGKQLSMGAPIDAIRNGIGLLPEERKRQGIVNCLSVKDNITLIYSQLTAKFGFLKKAGDDAIVRRYIDTLHIKTPSAMQAVGNLSGGNQQKVVVSKWLSISPRILLLDEPTQGIDVGAKADIYQLIDRLAREGMGVIVVSSDLIEIINLSNRIVVMRDGQAIKTLESDELTEENVMLYAMGVNADEKT